MKTHFLIQFQTTQALLNRQQCRPLISMLYRINANHCTYFLAMKYGVP